VKVLHPLDRCLLHDFYGRVPGEDGYDTGLGYLLLDYSHPHPEHSMFLCGTVPALRMRRCEQGRAEGRERISRLAGEAATFAELSAQRNVAEGGL